MGKIILLPTKRDGKKNTRDFIKSETVGIWATEIDRAIARIKDSTFGRCPVCLQPLPAAPVSFSEEIDCRPERPGPPD